MKEDKSEEKHQDWTNNPVLNDGESKDFFVPEYLMEFFVPDLCERWVHHENQPDCDRN